MGAELSAPSYAERPVLGLPHRPRNGRAWVGDGMTVSEPHTGDSAIPDIRKCCLRRAIAAFPTLAAQATRETRTGMESSEEIRRPPFQSKRRGADLIQSRAAWDRER